MEVAGPRLGDLGELGVLRELRAVYADVGAPVPAGWLGIGDDAAAIPPPKPGHKLLLTVDSLVEGVHFERAWAPPRFIGRKAMAVNLSDLAAMGGTPTAALVALTLPPSLPLAFVTELARGIAERGAAHDTPVIGGNLTRGDAISITITVLGACEDGRVVTRAAGGAGDELFVTGLLGSARAGLFELRSSKQAARRAESAVSTSAAGSSLASAIDDELACLLAQLDPVPRLREGAFAAAYASAMVDLSDGLGSDAAQLARASGLCAELDLAHIPRRLRVSLETALTGGEDYELLCAVPSQRAGELVREGRRRGFHFHRVGGLVEGEGAPAGSVFLRHDDGRRVPLALAAFEHFSKK